MTVYEYLVSIKDKASDGMKRISRAAGGTDNSMKRMTRAADGSSVALRRTATSSGFLQSSLTSLRSTIAATFAVASIAAFSVGIIKAGSALEQTQISFETMLGSAQKATKVLGDLNQFANVTPFTNDEVVQSGRSLIAFGTDAEKLIPTLKTIGDVASGLKIPFNDLSDIYGKIMVSQTVYGEDLNQLAGRGIPIFKELAAVMGVQESQIKKMASEAKISFSEIELAFQRMSGEGGAFFNMMEKQSTTFGGLWSTLIGKLNSIRMDMGLQLTEQLKPALQVMIDMITPGTELNETMRTIGGTLSNLAQLTGIAAASWLAYVAVSKVMIAIETIKYMWMMKGIIAQTLMASSTGILASASAALNAIWLANPVGVVVAGLVAVGGIMVWLYNKFDWFRGGVWGLWESFKEVFVSIADIAKNVLGGIWDMISGIWERDFDKVKSGFKKFGEGLLSTTPAGFAHKYGKSVADSFQKGYNDGIGKDGVSPVEALMSGGSKYTVTPSTNGTPTNSNADKGIEGITAGGSKSVTINMGGVKVSDEINIMPSNLSEGLAEIEEKFKELMIRTLQGGLHTAGQ